MHGVGLDFSEVMLDGARKRFVGDERVELVQHDLSEPLPALGRFDTIISSFAIHHLEHERKRTLIRPESRMIPAVMPVSRTEAVALFPTRGAIPEELQIGRASAIGDMTSAAEGGSTLIFAEDRRLGKSSMLLA